MISNRYCSIRLLSNTLSAADAALPRLNPSDHRSGLPINIKTNTIIILVVQRIGKADAMPLQENHSNRSNIAACKRCNNY